MDLWLTTVSEGTGALLAVSSGTVVRTVIAVVASLVLIRVGMKILGGFSRPVPEPPDPGELRRVRLTYRCAICATEVRMTMANDEVPEPPRHCQDDMDLITSPYDE